THAGEDVVDGEILVLTPRARAATNGLLLERPPTPVVVDERLTHREIAGRADIAAAQAARENQSAVQRPRPRSAVSSAITMADSAAHSASRSSVPSTMARARSRMYSALRVEYLSARISGTLARASRAGAGNAQTVSLPIFTGVPNRRTSRARHAKANERVTCWAASEPPSIAKGR